ncbi:hypothetical protein HPP92_009222 [Vanilla planifolia]|uniref:Uncharacterized protein n=1 Tax=Vanilla planifolia TaxID=51239 RepID=A0A835R7H2_VANPL|nr:hypothetical protein HPP92_009222 [Vanilla planifolia]
MDSYIFESVGVQTDSGEPKQQKTLFHRSLASSARRYGRHKAGPPESITRPGSDRTARTRACLPPACRPRPTGATR